jgi:hypothetical protein
LSVRIALLTLQIAAGCGALLAAILAVGSAPAFATPQFARQTARTCNACHAVVPRLHAGGLAFAVSGYRIAPDTPSEDTLAPRLMRTSGIPLAAWVTVRSEDRGGEAASDLYLPKVELVSGGPLMRQLSYFVEWRIVSLALENDGSLTDRGGRFEDLFLDWAFTPRQSVKVGQFRSLNQVDVSQRLSQDEPLLFNNALPTGSSTDPRIAGLERFSPGARSPSVSWSWRSRAGERASDGLFHYLTVPFTGELSIPLGPEASDRASFELRGPKGVHAETFYRRGLRSIGVHAMYDDDAWLATAVGTFDWRDFIFTSGVGVDDREAVPSRERGSLEVEYLLRHYERFRAAAGLRVEDVSGDHRRARYVPYVALAGPNTQYTMLL